MCNYFKGPVYWRRGKKNELLNNIIMDTIAKPKSRLVGWCVYMRDIKSTKSLRYRMCYEERNMFYHLTEIVE